MVRKSCAYKKVHKSEELAPEECDKKGIQTAFFGLDFGVLRRRLNASGTLAKATACSIGLNAKDAQASIYSNLGWYFSGEYGLHLSKMERNKSLPLGTTLRKPPSPR